MTRKTILSFGVVFLVALCAASRLSGQAAGQHEESNNRVVLEQIVARVNNQIITLSDLEVARQRVRRELGDQFSGAELQQKLQEGEANLLRDLIDQQLLVQRGEDLGLSIEPEVIRYLDRLRQDLNLPSMEALEAAITQRGMSFEDYRQDVRNQIMTRMVMQREVAGKVMLDEQVVRDYYLQHREEMARPEQVHLREILVSTVGAAGEALEAREERVREALEKIRKGEPFEEVAKNYSDSPTAAEGGELGLFEPDKLSEAIRDVVMKLRAGGVTDPLQTPQGYLILQLVQHYAAGVPAFEVVESEIRQKLYFDQVQPALREYLSQMRRENFVLVAAGYIDTGAVEGEFKPGAVRSGSRRARKGE
ncbi:MAG: peptidylprolyl isomerase [Acidobacteria bacterium]|nr:peptidylprolyl isomerase [Acidobacteriota bacterium]